MNAEASKNQAQYLVRNMMNNLTILIVLIIQGFETGKDMLMTLLDEFEGSDDTNSPIQEDSLGISLEELDKDNPFAACRSLIWQCFSKVLEKGIKHMKEPDDIYHQLNPILYKAVFHGGIKSMWSSVMEV